MKPLTLFYCHTETARAAEMAREIRQRNENAQLHDACSFDGSIEDCNHVYIMPEVGGWMRDRIAHAYPGLVRELSAVAEPAHPTAAELGLPDAAPLTVKHRGRGKFYVMRGVEIVSGPHTKDEAQGYVASCPF